MCWKPTFSSACLQPAVKSWRDTPLNPNPPPAGSGARYVTRSPRLRSLNVQKWLLGLALSLRFSVPMMMNHVRKRRREFPSENRHRRVHAWDRKWGFANVDALEVERERLFLTHARWELCKEVDSFFFSPFDLLPDSAVTFRWFSEKEANSLVIKQNRPQIRLVSTRYACETAALRSSYSSHLWHLRSISDGHHVWRERE